MLPIALAPNEGTLWGIALAVGFVVLGVVVALLTLLFRLIRDVDVGVSKLGELADRLEHDMSGVDLARTATIMRELREEVLVHDDLLSRR